MYALHEAHERDHWWHAARRRIVLQLLRRELRFATRPLRVLDIGCGAGGMLEHLRAFGEVAGVDPSPNAVALAEEKGTAPVYLGGLPHGLPFAESERFDVITLLDVLEHIDEDAASLATLRHLLAPDGLLLLTVPAFPFMWSSHDVVNEHKRRYTRRTLRERLVQARFRIGTLSYYNTILFPPIAAMRVAGRLLGGIEGDGDLGAVPGPVNGVLRSLFGAERFVIGKVTLPFGVSLIATARPMDEHGGW